MITIKKPDIRAKRCDNCQSNKDIRFISVKKGTKSSSLALCRKCRQKLELLLFMESNGLKDGKDSWGM